MNKTEMGRFIVQVLYNLDNLPPADHFHVKRIVRDPKPAVAHTYGLAIDANKVRLAENERYS